MYKILPILLAVLVFAGCDPQGNLLCPLEELVSANDTIYQNPLTDIDTNEWHFDSYMGWIAGTFGDIDTVTGKLISGNTNRFYSPAVDPFRVYHLEIKVDNYDTVAGRIEIYLGHQIGFEEITTNGIDSIYHLCARLHANNFEFKTFSNVPMVFEYIKAVKHADMYVRFTEVIPPYSIYNSLPVGSDPNPYGSQTIHGCMYQWFNRGSLPPAFYCIEFIDTLYEFRPL